MKKLSGPAQMIVAALLASQPGGKTPMKPEMWDEIMKKEQK